MPRNNRLVTDQDFREAMERRTPVRVFRDDMIVDSGGLLVRFDESVVVLQSGVGDVAYHDREQSEFFEMPSK
ncbi:hypothetical protein [Paenibacillus sp.]|uniref:hypothetical protein n=1 Tax=Paenibacillus sp. TaxID=58172 RepID=UPI002D4368A9|nr:hypothetical protein [Paenibacillus sp.]HZG86462.1 hypothetical protein [Paenibacillus sp.]